MDELIQIPSSLLSTSTYATTGTCTTTAQCGTGQCGNSQCGVCQSTGEACTTRQCTTVAQCGTCQVVRQCTTVAQCGTCQATCQSECSTIAECGICQLTLCTDETMSSTTPVVDYWDWSVSNGSANANQTQAAYSAVANNGETSEFSYLVWNDMCAKVKEVRDAVSGIGSWDTGGSGGLSYNNTLMTSSDKVLTADRFNTLRYNIGSQYSTGISEVYTGDVVYGSYFITLMEKVNEWIDTL